MSCTNRSPNIQVIDLPEVPTLTEPRQLTSGSQGSLTEVAPPAVLLDLNELIADKKPSLKISSPKANQIIEATSLAIDLRLRGLSIYKEEKTGLGPHIQISLDNQPARAIYDLNEPIEFTDLAPGTHTIRALTIKPWGESFKNPEAFTETTFHIYAPTQENAPDADLPELVYSQPQGTYSAEPILLDFYLNNAPLHLLAAEDDTLPDWKIRADINGQSFFFNQWQPMYLRGFKPGQNWIQLTLVDAKGNRISNAFNSTVRLINYDPTQQTTLSQLMRGELPLKDVGQIVDPNYVPPAIPKPLPEPEPKQPASNQQPAPEQPKQTEQTERIEEQKKEKEEILGTEQKVNQTETLPVQTPIETSTNEPDEDLLEEPTEANAPVEDEDGASTDLLPSIQTDLTAEEDPTTPEPITQESITQEPITQEPITQTTPEQPPESITELEPTAGGERDVAKENVPEENIPEENIPEDQSTPDSEVTITTEPELTNFDAFSQGRIVKELDDKSAKENPTLTKENPVEAVLDDPSEELVGNDKQSVVGPDDNLKEAYSTNELKTEASPTMQSEVKIEEREESNAEESVTKDTKITEPASPGFFEQIQKVFKQLSEPQAPAIDNSEPSLKTIEGRTESNGNASEPNAVEPNAVEPNTSDFELENNEDKPEQAESPDFAEIEKAEIEETEPEEEDTASVQLEESETIEESETTVQKIELQKIELQKTDGQEAVTPDAKQSRPIPETLNAPSKPNDV